MTEQTTITPTAIAAELDIQAVTLRRWCAVFSDHLSPLANPSPGNARRFTKRDRDVLIYVRKQRSLDRSLPEIADLLIDLSFPEVDDLPVEQATDTHQLDIIDSHVTSVAAPPGAQIEQRVESIVIARIDALQAQITDMKATSRSYVAGLAMGFVLALLFVLVLVGIAILYGGYR